MNKKPSIFLRFMKQCETRDQHFDSSLKSHYYKTSFEKVYNTVLDLINTKDEMAIISQSKEHGEISVQVQNKLDAFLIITIIQVRPFETSVDFMISSEKFSLTGLYPSLKKVILEMYKELDSKLPRKE